MALAAPAFAFMEIAFEKAPRAFLDREGLVTDGRVDPSLAKTELDASSLRAAVSKVYSLFVDRGVEGVYERPVDLPRDALRALRAQDLRFFHRARNWSVRGVRRSLYGASAKILNSSFVSSL